MMRKTDEDALLQRITVNPTIFGGKPIIRGRRLAVEHVLAMLAAGDTPETILEGYPWLEPEDIQACWASEQAAALGQVSVGDSADVRCEDKGGSE